MAWNQPDPLATANGAPGSAGTSFQVSDNCAGWKDVTDPQAIQALEDLSTRASLDRMFDAPPKQLLETTYTIGTSSYVTRFHERGGPQISSSSKWGALGTLIQKNTKST